MYNPNLGVSIDVFLLGSGVAVRTGQLTTAVVTIMIKTVVMSLRQSSNANKELALQIMNKQIESKV